MKDAMSPKRMIFRAIVRCLEKLSCYWNANDCYNSNLVLDTLPDGKLDLIIIAFNNSSIIRHQIKYVRTHIKDDYTYIVADNSNSPEASLEIRSLCEQEGVPYIRLPKNYLGIIGPSYSHATALNWVYKNIVCKRKPSIFGFIDHDLFPVRDIIVSDYLQNQPVYGAKRSRGSEWYLSAIMSFFRLDYVIGKKVDFMPVTPTVNYLDTGGGNWYEIYSQLNPDNMKFASEYVENFKEGTIRHQDQVEIFDQQWLHTINGSYWKKVDSKDDMIEFLVEKYEQKLKS